MLTLHQLRLKYIPRLPAVFQSFEKLTVQPQKVASINSQMTSLFPKIADKPILRFVEGNPNHDKLVIGVVLSGGQAPGGHNVITGLFDALKRLNPHSRLIGFLNGPGGILKNQTRELTSDILANYRNQGGFDLIGSDRTKIETPEQFAQAADTVQKLDLDGLVIIGGDDSNTNAAFLAEYFLQRGIKTSVIGVPKTIDGDLKNDYIEVSFGFDTAAKTYSEIIGNIARDTLSAKKAYYFIKLMGRSASHITLECALQTHANYTLIGEELAKQKMTLQQVTNQLADIVVQRSQAGKDYGIFLIPEGIIEFIPEFKVLISELNRLVAEGKTDPQNQLSKESKACWELLPERIQEQLLLDRDPHGNVQVSKIETERLLIDLVAKELSKRKTDGSYKGKFSAQPHFCGYEGRSCYPSNFDADYCYALGFTAAALLSQKATGYIVCLSDLIKPPKDWRPGGIPLVQMMAFEERHGKPKAVLAKALVELEGKPFQEFVKLRANWILEDDYQFPGPIHFFGPDDLTNALNHTLQLESESK